jgi:hypothetical protein
MVVGEYTQIVSEIFSIAETQTIEVDQVERIKGLLFSEESQLAADGKDDFKNAFFGRIVSSRWLTELEQEILKCPNVIVEQGRIKAPRWPAADYLKRMIAVQGDIVIKLVVEIYTDNPWYFELLCEIISEDVEKANEIIVERLGNYIVSEYRFSSGRLLKALTTLVEAEKVDFSLQLLGPIVKFVEDPKKDEKQEERKKNSDTVIARYLEPQPLFKDWDFNDVIEKFVRPLAEKSPFETSIILVKATAHMIELKYGQEETTEGEKKDHSTVWCQRVDEKTGDHDDPKEILVHALTYASQQVFNHSSEFVGELNDALRQPPWEIFNRIRQHLYSLNVDVQTRPWIREEILGYRDYNQWDYHYEFQKMVKIGCDTFKRDLVSDEELILIFEAILGGPSKRHFKEWIGESYTPELFDQRQKQFHLKQLTPFAAVLFGKYDEHYQRLISESEKSIGDEDYAPYKSEGVKTIHQKSPKSVDELKEFDDEALLTFINEWEDVHRESESWWVDINYEGLALAFQQVFKEHIIGSKHRLEYWQENRNRIFRPIFARAIVKAFHELLEAKEFDELGASFEFCAWVLIQPNKTFEEGSNPSDASKEMPDWRSTRRAVRDFVGACVQEGIDVPINYRAQIAALLDALCNAKDNYLEEVSDSLGRDILNIAINQTRSLAIEDFINFGYWVRRNENNGKSEIPELFESLEKRLSENCEWPLTLPEYALLGYNFRHLLQLNEEWTKQWNAVIFPSKKKAEWYEAFSNFIKHQGPDTTVYEILNNDYETALSLLNNFNFEDKHNQEFVDGLGRHCFSFYLWDLYPLEGKESFLTEFYVQTTKDKKRWARLFDGVGRMLKKGASVDAVKKCLIFFEWRYKQKELKELREYSFWIDADCLDPKWRLKSFLKILKFGAVRDDLSYIALEVLDKFKEDHTDLVFECLSKLADHVPKEDYIYLQTSRVKPILAFGLENSSEAIRELAEQIRENFLKVGRFEFLNIED